MAQPIYKVWLSKYRDAWYDLTSGEQTAVMDKINAALKQVGGERVITCISRWASEQWIAWGVEKFPNIEAVQKFESDLIEMGQDRYMESESYLGTEFPAG